MDNQQETLTAYIAGLYDGEGSFYINRVRSRKIWNYRANCTFTNTDPVVIQKFIDWCKYHMIKHHIRADIRTRGKRVCYSVAITSLDSKLRFISLVKPYITGWKLTELELAEQFLALRSIKLKLNIRTRDENGHFKSGMAPQNHEEENIWLEYRKHKDSPETTRKAPVQFV